MGNPRRITTVRVAALWLVAVLILVVINQLIVQKERILDEGTMMLLELDPRDPRSLIQGDYMALRYELPPALTRDSSLSLDGHLVVALDADHVATVKRVHRPGQPLAEDEHLLRYRKRGGAIRLGAESFFFQEGHAPLYAQARYGELRVSSSGESVLVGLRDDSLNVLGPPDAP